jgi:hypothetical protein
MEAARTAAYRVPAATIKARAVATANRWPQVCACFATRLTFAAMQPSTLSLPVLE